MTNWNSGYVTDIDYVYGYYREMAPNILSHVLCRSDAGPDSNGPLAYCELGCGQGFSVNLLAAANPHIQFYANDFNPSHIYGAGMLAALGGSENAHFFDNSFAEFIKEPSLPEFDVIALHGIYSWVNSENRQHIINFIRTKLKIGGLVYVSYNAMPGWAAMMPLRRLMIDPAFTGVGSMAARVERAVALLEGLIEVEPAYVAGNAALKQRVGMLRKESRPNYIAHEYFNSDLTPFYHSEIVNDFAEAKVTYLGSANLAENDDGQSLTPRHSQFLQGFVDRTERETMRDFLVNQSFRRDVFVKGVLPLSAPESDYLWGRLRFVLAMPRADVPMKVQMGHGEATLAEEVYGPIFDSLASGPRTIAQLFEDARIAALGHGTLRQVLTVSVGFGLVHLALAEDDEQERQVRTHAFNGAVLSRSRLSDDFQFLASPVTGGAILVNRISQLFLLARRQGRSDGAAFAWESLSALRHFVVKDGVKLENPEDNLAALEEFFNMFNAKELPLLMSLGIS